MVCSNGPKSTVLNNRFLARHFGMTKMIAALRFVCRRYRSQRYRVRLVPDHLGEKEPLRMQLFDSIYEKHLD